MSKILMTNGSLRKVKSIAECSIGAFYNTFDLHSAIIGLKTNFFFEWQLKTSFIAVRVFTGSDLITGSDQIGPEMGYLAHF